MINRLVQGTRRKVLKDSARADLVREKASMVRRCKARLHRYGNTSLSVVTPFVALWGDG